MQVQLGGVAVNVADLDRSIAFYEGVFGLAVLQRIPLPTMTEVILGPPAGATGASVMLVQQDRGAPPDPSDQPPPSRPARSMAGDEEIG